MPAPYVGSDEIVQINKGTVTFSAAYVGSEQVFAYDPTQVLTLTSTTDLNLATWLAGQGAVTTKPVIINVASDQIIGGTVASGYAMTVGDVSAYDSITMNLDGQIQGKVGSHAIHSVANIDIQNGGTISGAVVDVGGGGSSNLTIVVGATGKILAGGGNGGNGGAGGVGADIINNTSYRDGCWSDSAYRTPVVGDSSRLIIYWGTGATGSKSGSTVIYSGSSVTMINCSSGGYIYRKGSLGCTENGNGWYDIRRGQNASGSAGSGGAGGVGQGYLQTKTLGAAGSAGTYRSGSGGDGGDGGDWGVAGGNGNNGGTGYYWTSTSDTVARGGSSGSSGTSAGNAIVSDGTVTIT